MHLLAVVTALVSTTASLAQQRWQPPHLSGSHFRITALHENGFLEISDEPDGSLTYTGYLIDMLEAIATRERANFTYTLVPPSGHGSRCLPQLSLTETSNSVADYDRQYRTQYNCGTGDVNDASLLGTNYSTDMYLGMYYISPERLLTNQFSTPFVPPFSGTLTMLGIATGIPNLEALAEQQQAGLQPTACAPGGTALIQFLEESFPGLQVKGVFGGEDDIYQAFQSGECEVYITDGPIAAQFVLRRFRSGECHARDMPIGVIGEAMKFGLSHYAIGIRQDMSPYVVNTISYWMNHLMSCNPLDEAGLCPDGNLASFFERTGGKGDECGYVLYPAESNPLSAAAIAGVFFAVVGFVVLVITLWHRYRLSRQRRLYAKRSRLAMQQAQRERELNEFLAHEIRNPLSSALAALSFVSAKASDPVILSDMDTRKMMCADLNVAESSLQFINELLRNMLDLHRSAANLLETHMLPTDLLRDVLEPVASILFMRGARVEIIVECPENLFVTSDRLRLKQICLNLASNSSKFVEQGYIKLHAETIKDNVLIHVEDTGSGIPVDKRKNLFAKFQESLDTLAQGTGIGLSLCKGLSEALGADLFLDESYVSNLPDYPGARFTIRLNQRPIRVDVTAEDSSQVSEGHEAPLESSTQNTLELPEGLAVLFVDDDMVLRKLFTRVLSRVAPTWRIKEASNGETALKMTTDESFDLIFVDQYMASIEKQLLGSETVKLMRGNGITSVLCGLSANDVEGMFMEAGADAFLLKPFPFDKESLKAELLRILNERKHR